MQLVEQDQLDLNADVSQYLSTFRIPATLSEPITLSHLLTHTAGFEDWSYASHARPPADLDPLGLFLSRSIPARLFPPGEASGYSNYGAALAGYLVALASGLGFEDYVETHILEPLGMSSTSFRQPLPPALAPQLATDYDASLAPGELEWDLARPADALSSTAADMARFMIALLQEGRLGTRRILKAETVATMQRRRFTNHPAVSGLTYGFQELNIAGQRILAQPGDMPYFTAALFLLPKHELGLFVADTIGEAPRELQ
jgi:CubicO group peptidase (beta-lactamase class C family)